MGKFGDDLERDFPQLRNICKLRLPREIEQKIAEFNEDSTIMTKIGEKVNDYGRRFKQT